MSIHGQDGTEQIQLLQCFANLTMDDLSPQSKVLMLPELLNLILSHVKDVDDLKSCNLVSNLWHDLTTPIIDKKGVLSLKNEFMAQDFLENFEIKERLGLTPRACRNLRISYNPNFMYSGEPDESDESSVKLELGSVMKIIGLLQGSLTTLDIKQKIEISGFKVEEIPSFHFPSLSILNFYPSTWGVTAHNGELFVDLIGEPRVIFDKLLINILQGATGSLKKYTGYGLQLENWETVTVMGQLSALTHLDMDGCLSQEDLQGMTSLQEAKMVGLLENQWLARAVQFSVSSMTRLEIKPSKLSQEDPLAIEFFGMTLDTIRPIYLIWPNLTRLTYVDMDDLTLQEVFQHLRGIEVLEIGRRASTFGLTGIWSPNGNYNNIITEVNNDPNALERIRGPNNYIGHLSRLKSLSICESSNHLRDDTACVKLGIVYCTNLKELTILERNLMKKSWCLDEMSLMAISTHLSLEKFILMTPPAVKFDGVIIENFKQSNPGCYVGIFNSKMY